jgi:DNA-binding XRE family transcriptional regulator
MPNIGSLLREEISRLSRREIRNLTDATKKATSLHRRHIASLNRKVAQLERELARLARKGAVPADGRVPGATATPIRFVAKGLRSHRDRLGLSAGEFGKLMGASAASIYAWEQGRTTPRREQVMKIAELRKLGKREAARRLEAKAARRK